ncbi:biotin--[acetyl-CoA-carboxylase] ligase [Desulfofalx alkaliphila]|uniref:biotin--[acetyl-CoA-carboxylase] ligase n=1 Tax=Desulfofalx alkaliphila TaxID=105483 RepID=UPI0004E1FE16|nr:biotin--[acetyl-CoA-carboxylase] ligase [Desulfofalx alkaliphila]
MRDKVLHTLKKNKGRWVSGEDICKQLAISRTMVWKHIGSLKEQGYQIETQRRLGYRLLKSPDILYPQEIYAGLNTKLMGSKIIHLERVDSTNEVAKGLARQGAEEGTVVIAEEQNCGKGRLGRHWYSAAGKDIVFSVLLKPKISLSETPQVSMLAAVAVARAMEAVCDTKVGIKWPNDLLINNKKFCGILVEIGAEIDCVRHVVLGIGINVNSLADNWPREIRGHTSSLRAEVGEKLSRVKVLQAVLKELDHLYSVWKEEGFAAILKLWRTWCISQHCNARVETLQGSYTGRIEGVNNTGELLLRMSDGSIRAFSSGDVSLRL